MLEKKSFQSRPKVKCLFQDKPAVESESPQTAIANRVRRSIAEELRLIVEMIEKYQHTVFPFLSRIQQLLVHVLQEVYCFGPTKIIGSFCDNLHLPWSDLNFFVNCNEGLGSKKNSSNQNKSNSITPESKENTLKNRIEQVFQIIGRIFPNSSIIRKTMKHGPER